MQFPVNPSPGQCFQGWVWNGCQWVCAAPVGFTCTCGCNPCQCGGGGGVAPPQIPVGPNPPATPGVGTMWFDGSTLWIWNGFQWVAVGGGSGPYQVFTYLTPGSYTFQVPNNVAATTVFRFRMIAGGGGGGGTTATSAWSSMGGGGGEFKEFYSTGLAAGTVCALTVATPGTGGLGAGTVGNDGVAGGDSSVLISATNTTIICKGGGGGWGSANPTNTDGQGLGGIDGAFVAGLANIVLALNLPGADAHFGESANDPGVGGADSHWGFGAPGFNHTIGWNDTTRPRGYGAGGRGTWNNNTQGGNGTGGAIIIERVKS